MIIFLSKREKILQLFTILKVTALTDMIIISLGVFILFNFHLSSSATIYGLSYYGEVVGGANLNTCPFLSTKNLAKFQGITFAF